MAETGVNDREAGCTSGPATGSLHVYSSPLYMPPTWQDVRAVIARLELTGAQVGALVGVHARTVRKWTSTPGTSNHAPIPYSAWRLLLIAAGLVHAPRLA